WVRELPRPRTTVATVTRIGATPTASSPSAVASRTSLLFGSSQSLHVGSDRCDVGVGHLFRHRGMLRVCLDAGGDVGVGHPGYLGVAGERGYLHGLAGRGVGLARLPVAAGAVLLEDCRSVGGGGH